MKNQNDMKSHRISKKLSMKELSLKTGISERYLYFIENVEKTPSLKTAKKISSALDTTMDSIFFWPGIELKVLKRYVLIIISDFILVEIGGNINV